MAAISVPTPLRKVTKGRRLVEVCGPTLGRSLDDLEKQFPGVKERILDGSGSLRRFVNIYVNGEDARFLAGMETPISDGDEISIVPAVAGGR